MDNHSDIERTVMRRVHLIRILQLVISTVVFATLASIAALWGIGREVWVARVFENAPPNLDDLPRFYLAAFTHTRLIVQALIVLTSLSLLFLAREVVRFFGTMAAPSRA
ncbi:MAG TPA: hypothetical protein VMV62_01045 [Candidatus Paceibacterota bacterium]|nr:hypothetical protein [Candidatus Paceibacterota bacterium]